VRSRNFGQRRVAVAAKIITHQQAEGDKGIEEIACTSLMQVKPCR
jgi:hypothetical protein